MFGNVPPTPYDLRFSILGMPVRVHPAFWLIAGMFGFRSAQSWADALQTNELAIVLLWIGCVFVSILIHELGHALAARSLGTFPEIVLYHFGGLALYQPPYGHTRGKSIFIAFSGPGAGFVVFGVVLLSEYLMVLNDVRPPALLIYVIVQMKFINLWWGLLNLLPVLPLDGGHISEDVCNLINRRKGQEWAYMIAIAVAGGVAALFLTQRDYYIGILFGVLCYQNFQSLQQYRSGYW